MNTSPIPHPESSELLRQQAILETHLKVGEIITAAAEGAGTITPLRSERVNNSYTAHDYSDNPRFRNGFGAIVRDVDAFVSADRLEALTPDGERVVAETVHNVVGRVYPIDVSQSYRRFDSMGNLIDVVEIQLGWNGDYFEPKVMVSKQGEEYRELSGEEELEIKVQIANAFGLQFDLKPRPLSQHKDSRFEVSSNTKSLVDGLVAELMVEGLTGNKLRAKLLRELHPDLNPDRSDVLEAFKYASSLNYEDTLRVVRDRNVAKPASQDSSKAT
jgi:hypothetical protein